MIRRVMSNIDVVKGLKCVLERIEAAATRRPEDAGKGSVRLVAVSKTKPVELIAAAYATGQRHFGENYVQELVDKANDAKVRAECPDICWHLIGHLQRNKVAKLVGVPGLYLVESVESEKLASALDDAWKKLDRPGDRLRVMVQINTSCEAEKSGCKLEEATDLARHVLEKCGNLQLVGLMTIGKYGYDTSLGPNPDFVALLHAHRDVCRSLGLELTQLELSMGMSDDFEQAVEMGSTNVRVGSAIFGHREKKHVSTVDQITEDTHNTHI